MKLKNTAFFSVDGRSLSDFMTSFGKLTKLPLPIAALYKLKTLASKLGEKKKIYDETRNDLILKWGTDNGNGKKIIDSKSENLSNFTKELAELVSEPFEIDLDKIVLELDGAKDYGLTTLDLELLDEVLEIRVM